MCNIQGSCHPLGGITRSHKLLHIANNRRPPVEVAHELSCRPRVPVTDIVVEMFQHSNVLGYLENNSQPVLRAMQKVATPYHVLDCHLVNEYSPLRVPFLVRSSGQVIRHAHKAFLELSFLGYRIVSTYVTGEQPDLTFVK